MLLFGFAFFPGGVKKVDQFFSIPTVDSFFGFHMFFFLFFFSVFSWFFPFFETATNFAQVTAVLHQAFPSLARGLRKEDQLIAPRYIWD